jgi:membrane-associated phospholipid phosphatase
MPHTWSLKHPLYLVPSLLVVFSFGFNAGKDVRASDNIEKAGDVLLYVLPATAVGMTLIYKDGKGALQFGASMTLTVATTYALKYTVHEERPNGGQHSFPSGHTSISFSSAEFLRKRYGWEYGMPAYLAATFVAYSRVEAEEHHLQDVIAGAAIGVISSYIFTRPYKGLQVQMDAGSRYYGVRLIYAW